jgi:beta-glucosidase
MNSYYCPYYITLFLFFNLIANEQIVFNKSFLKGVALSAYQNGGDRWGLSNWSLFETKKNIVHKPTISHNQRCCSSTGFWDRAHDDIKLIKDLGCNAVRFSIEWASIEPTEGLFNEAALDFYERYCDALLEQGIEPMVTLYHFTHPLWFDLKKGWELENNIDYFVRYSSKVFERLGSKVTLWCTINEPTVYSFMGYILGMHAPGKQLQFRTAGTVLCNLLDAHVRVYQTLKSMPGGKNASIGIVHQLLKSQPYSSWHITGTWLSKFLNFCAAHNQTFECLKTGNFDYSIPGITSVRKHLSGMQDSYDFIGLNYYSRVVFGFGPTCYPCEVMTDMEYAMHPQGIYDAIVEMSSLDKPIYITENGLADEADVNRSSFIKTYLHSVHKAVSDGYDVRGYFYWTLMDNFEWDRGFSMKFGLYEVNFATQERRLRPGAYAYRDYCILQS